MPDPQNRTAGMVRRAGAEFQMGAAPLRPEEGPPQTVKVAPFWIDQTEVTNAAFAPVVDATVRDPVGSPNRAEAAGVTSA